MSNALTLKRITSDRRSMTVTFEGDSIAAFEGDTVAAAVLAAGYRTTRNTPVSGQSRAPFCMMGVCFECLVSIDGVPNRQACMVQVSPGMTINRMDGARSLGAQDHQSDGASTDDDAD